MQRCFCNSELNLFLELFDAIRADVLSFIADDVLGAVAENAGRMILVKNDIIAFNKNLKSVFFSDVQCAAQFDREYDSAQLINLS